METLHPSVHLSRGFCGEGWQHGVMLCVVWGLGVALLMWGLPVIKGHLCQKYLSVVSSFTWVWGQGEDGDIGQGERCWDGEVAVGTSWGRARGLDRDTGMKMGTLG